MKDPAGFLVHGQVDEYAKRCTAIHGRLVHSNLAAHMIWEILEFRKLAGDIFLPQEWDLLQAVITHAADRVVVTVVALTERRADTLNFGALSKFLERHSRADARRALAAMLAELKLAERGKGLLGHATRTRHELIAHFNTAQATGAATDDRRLLIGDVLALQDEAEAIFDVLRVDRTVSYTSLTALTRETLHFLAAAYGERVKGDAKEALNEMIRPGTTLPTVSPWLLGKPPQV